MVARDGRVGKRKDRELGRELGQRVRGHHPGSWNYRVEKSTGSSNIATKSKRRPSNMTEM
jgi:hypothetical protein